MNEKNKEEIKHKLKLKLYFELHQHIDEVDFYVVADCYNKLQELEGFSVRVTKEQCEDYYRKNPVIKSSE